MSTSSVPCQVPAQIPVPKPESPKFDFKFATPIPTRFQFGGQFSSPPKSGAPEYIKTREPVLGVDKAQFTFELPPNTEPERFSFRQSFGENQYGQNELKRQALGSQALPRSTLFGSTKADKAVQSSPSPQLRPLSNPRKKDDKQETVESKNTFTIITRQEPQPPPRSFIHKSLQPIKSQAYTYHIDPLPETQISQSFPPSTIPDTTKDDVNLCTPSDTPSSHRRTKSVATPTRSSRRAKLPTTYAEDSHREFIRDLRQVLGLKRAQRDLEEREIDKQIAKLREEGQAVESTLAGEIPKLPELLARRVHEALFDTPDEVVVVENSFGKLCGRDIHRLQRGEWLNDEIINYYLQMVRERSFNSSTTSKVSTRSPKKTLPKIHIFNTFFYQLLSTRGYTSVRRWTKKAKVNLFDMDRVVIPINKGGFHWILVIVNVTQKRIEYYDSMGRQGESSENRPVLTNIRNFMLEEAKSQQSASPDEIAKWTFYVPVLTPPQFWTRDLSSD